MKIQYLDFFGIYDGVYPEGYCEHLISEFDRLESAGAGSDRIQSDNVNSIIKNDYQLNISLKGHQLNVFQNLDIVKIFFRGLQICYDEYVKTFPSLTDGTIRSTTMKMQRTAPGGGYHIWHSEQGSGDHASRVLVYMLYLNTLKPESAGETEFLYQQKRFSPTANQILIWPASYTHTHRGNTVFGKQSKYVVTGWFYYD